MLALYLKKNKKFSYVNHELPKRIEDNKCRIKICYSAICASDIPRAYFNQSYSYPLILGHEFSGKIEGYGSKVKGLNLGQRVSVFPLIPKCKKCKSCKQKKFNLCENYSYYGSRENGSFCEYIDINKWNIFPINNQLSLKMASLLEPTAVAFNVYNKINLRSKKNILIMGGGFISQVLLRILNLNKKFKITIADRNQFKLDLAKKYAYKTINLNLSNEINLDKSKKINDKFDCVIDSTGNYNAINFALSNLNTEGQFIVFGNIYKNSEVAKKNYNFLLRKELEVKGVWNSTFKCKKNNWEQAQTFLLKNSSKILPLISHVVDLKDAKKLMDDIYLNKINKKKLKYLKGIIKTQ